MQCSQADYTLHQSTHYHRQLSEVRLLSKYSRFGEIADIGDMLGVLGLWPKQGPGV